MVTTQPRSPPQPSTLIAQPSRPNTKLPRPVIFFLGNRGPNAPSRFLGCPSFEAGTPNSSTAEAPKEATMRGVSTSGLRGEGRSRGGERRGGGGRGGREACVRGHKGSRHTGQCRKTRTPSIYLAPSLTSIAYGSPSPAKTQMPCGRTRSHPYQVQRSTIQTTARQTHVRYWFMIATTQMATNAPSHDQAMSSALSGGSSVSFTPRHLAVSWLVGWAVSWLGWVGSCGISMIGGMCEVLY